MGTRTWLRCTLAVLFLYVGGTDAKLCDGALGQLRAKKFLLLERAILAQELGHIGFAITVEQTVPGAE